MDKKKSITDILSNFKREKEQFNEKLTQLRSKLQNVQSPDHTQYNLIINKTKFRSTKFDNYDIQGESYIMSPVVDNRRAKTL
jgi:hypothetical protein